jgi:integrase
VGSNPTPRTTYAPTELINFGLWLLRKGNRRPTVERKLRFLKALNGSIDSMISQVLQSTWVDKSKAMALLTLRQFAEYQGLPVPTVNFRVYDNREMYVPTPEMVKQFIYRIRKIELRAMVLIAVECGASASEVWNLKWKDVNLQSKSITITGVKGHRTRQYPMSNELVILLSQIPKGSGRIFSIKHSRHINDSIQDYRRRLALETGNIDFNKIHFHTFRHFAISWKYFRCKGIVETQRFARHCNIQNTLKYVHIVKGWIHSNQYDVVYADKQEEFTKYLCEGFELVEKTEWGHCLRRLK